MVVMTSTLPPGTPREPRPTDHFVVSATITADEYLATGDERPRYAELINGEVILSTPILRHQRVAAELRFLVTLWCKAAPGRGESPDSVDTKLDTGNVYAPDVWWVSEDHRPGRDAQYLDGPPDLAVEVRSPSTWRFDVGVKRETYERSGLPELWLIDTASETIIVYRRSSPKETSFDISLEVGRGETHTTPLMPEFALDVGALFDR